jgi:hypothetical protein
MPDWLFDQQGLAIVRRAYACLMQARNDRLKRLFDNGSA